MKTEGMTEPQKIRGKNSEVARFKELWRQMDDVNQDYWRERMTSRQTQKSIREEIKAKHGIDLAHDGQMTRLRRWVEEHYERAERAERMQENARRLEEEHPDWTTDQLRKEVLKRSYYESLEFANFKLGLSTARINLSEKAIELNRDKFEFDAARACLEQLPELKYISTNPQLSDTQKIDQIRLKLFGKIVP
jgi:hypothetical protein